MSGLLHALITELGAPVDIAVGHSAGAAIAAWMALDGLISPRRLIGVNAALLPLQGLAGVVFSPIAKALWATGAAPHLFAWRASNHAVVTRLLGTTGSKIDPEGHALYARLVRSPQHVSAALAMMAYWNLPALQERLPQLKVPLTQIVGQNDRTVPPGDAQRVQALLPESRIVQLADLGHLAHEERPDLVAGAINV
jgi:magnesium chelatase accessory protein